MLETLNQNSVKQTVMEAVARVFLEETDKKCSNSNHLSIEVIKRIWPKVEWTGVLQPSKAKFFRQNMRSTHLRIIKWFKQIKLLVSSLIFKNIKGNISYTMRARKWTSKQWVPKRCLTVNSSCLIGQFKNWLIELGTFTTQWGAKVESLWLIMVFCIYWMAPKSSTFSIFLLILQFYWFQTKTLGKE